MSGEIDILKLLKEMKPRLNSGEYVFTTVKDVDKIPRIDTLCEFKESEGYTLVLEKAKADKLGLTYELILNWITLNVHSSLEAIGLTAAVSNELANNGLSCNVIAGYYHDHVFIDRQNAKQAMEILYRLSENYK